MQFYVKDIMSIDLVTVRNNAQIRDLIKIFVNNEVSGVPVIDSDGYLVGVVSSRDVLQEESSHSFYYAPLAYNHELKLLEDAKFFDQPVSGIMSADLYTVDPNATIAKMAKIMYEKKIHRLLVTEYNKLVGIVSTFDLLKLLATSDETIVLQ